MRKERVGFLNLFQQYTLALKFLSLTRAKLKGKLKGKLDYA